MGNNELTIAVPDRHAIEGLTTAMLARSVGGWLQYGERDGRERIIHFSRTQRMPVVHLQTLHKTEYKRGEYCIYSYALWHEDGRVILAEGRSHMCFSESNPLYDTLDRLYTEGSLEKNSLKGGDTNGRMLHSSRL